MSRLDLSVSVDVPRPVTDVWQYVAVEYFDHHARWDTAITGMEALAPGPVGVGTRGVETRSFGGQQRAEFEVTQFDAPRSFWFRNLTGPFDVERSYVFTAVDAGTTLTFRFAMAPRGPMKIVFPLLRRTISGQVRANIARIPGLVTEASAV
jgi:hypothetical protein